ncbi:hypothetical protein LK542_24520 [Massilia sp. IC2-477]|uniref:hypothetical protein n=1 Tax=Massilia sp. IC2-477 TaxID=2887198 RepID=UPI001D128F3A|nr:hypothetical protein [Massilia sp. IC2-477]MCC2958780.1 hypothetical protein [Massilia sp. IC2-477]
MNAEIIELSEQRERRRYIALAHASGDWQETKASFALSGIILDESNAEIAGRMIAGEMTLKEAQRVILCRLNVIEKPM